MKDTHEDNDYEENGAPDGEGQNEFEKLYDQSLKSFKSGTVVRGRVLQVRTGVSGVVMLDLGYKSDGIIPAEQFTEEELKALKPGDELEVLLEAAEDANGNLLLSREKAKKLQAWDVLNRAYQTGAPLQGRVVTVIKGGLTVDIGGVTAFLPGSQIDIKPVHNLNQMVGQVLELKIIKMNSGRGNLVLSRRVLLEPKPGAKKYEHLASPAAGFPEPAGRALLVVPRPAPALHLHGPLRTAVVLEPSQLVHEEHGGQLGDQRNLHRRIAAVRHRPKRDRLEPERRFGG